MSSAGPDEPRAAGAADDSRPLRDVTFGLIERAKTGEAAAFDRLFARALPRLEWFVRLRIGSGLRARLEPEDVVQETYAAALPLLAGFEPEGEGTFIRWLLAIAENQVRRLVAHHGTPRRSALRLSGLADTALALAADPASGPCTRAARVERRSQVAHAIRLLPDDLREALLLRVVEGRQLREVAELMQRSESAVRRLVARATEALGRELEDEGASHA